MEPILTPEQLEFLGIENNESKLFWLPGYKFGGEDIYFYDTPSLSEILEGIFEDGKKSGATQRSEEIRKLL